jgi:hypothetical protein
MPKICYGAIASQMPFAFFYALFPGGAIFFCLAKKNSAYLKTPPVLR